ncbi:2,3-diaminopropionate biosynthesis protein SbnB [Streptomyces caelestis]|uniref:2,3-diaminopropionate biosynthesis protein SbnB n=1 Tax=Streptomyces heliomycini TaxID=284032 RepID=A0ABV5L5P4_9ACTN|nr:MULTISPECIES: 2,3-diaminopropionate biosynthesis protein SbnB [Streptomyces]
MKEQEFSVVAGATVHRCLAHREHEVIDIVEQAYRLHGEGRTINPPSYFLRFPDRPTSRIIALPASLGGDIGVDGLKWISSFPDNLAHGIPRASAVLILNDARTGSPYACLEASIISAVRTAASAALAARQLTRNRPTPRRIGFVGTGLIARYLYDYLSVLGWDLESVGLYDLSTEYARSFAGHLESRTPEAAVRVHTSAGELIRSSDVVVFATTAATPHVTDPDWFGHHPVVLHVSLRDLGGEVITAGSNIVDDVDHVLKADTSVHLVEQRTGTRDFIDGTLYQVLTGDVEPPADRTVIFSPFGLGVLDLAVGHFAYQQAARAHELLRVDGFFHDVDRHRSPDPVGAPTALGTPDGAR